MLKGRARRKKEPAMQSVLAAKFWNEEVESARSVEAVARSVALEPPPLGLLRSSKLSRSQQLLLLQQLMRLPCTPSLVPDSGLVLDRVLASAGGPGWWGTVTGRLRAQRLWSESNGFRDLLGQCLDGSLFALGARAHVKLAPNFTLSAVSELESIGDTSQGWRSRVSLRKKLQRHDVVCEGAWHEQLVDKDACYWDVPQVVSLDLSSVGAKTGLRYRVGVQHSAGTPQQTCPPQVVKSVPSAALPGTRAQAAVSFENAVQLWKGVHTPGGRRRRKPYNLIAAQPHVILSAIVGGLAAATRLTVPGGGEEVHDGVEARPYNSLVSADAFASLGLDAQFGLFQRALFDHTKFGARIDVGSASALAAALPSSAEGGATTALAKEDRNGPTIALTLQQQVVGPLRARVDARYVMDQCVPCSWPEMQDLSYGIDCSLEPTGAAKFVMWYSPTRREGMAEIRLLGK